MRRKGSIYLIGAAGGHADYAGNEVNALELNSEEPRWLQLTPPSPNDQVINRSQYYLDGKPSATHTYYATQFVDSDDRMIIVASIGLNGPFPNATTGFDSTYDNLSFSYDLGNQRWDDRHRVAEFPGKGFGDVFACLCVKHPTTNDIYYSRNYGNGWYRWSSKTNQWTRLSSISRSPWYAGSAIDPIRDRMLIVGGYDPIPPEVRDLNGQPVFSMFNGPEAASLSAIGNDPCVIFDEAADRYLVLFNSEDSIKTLEVNSTSWYTRAAPVIGTCPRARPNGIQNSAQYVPELRGVVIANSYYGDVYFMRTAL